MELLCQYGNISSMMLKAISQPKVCHSTESTTVRLIGIGIRPPISRFDAIMIA